MPYDLVGADDDLIQSIVSGMGDTEIVGWDDDDVGEIGAVGRPRSKRAGMKVVAKPLKSARRLAIGFGPTAFAASATADTTSNPQVVFRPERLFIPSDVAFDFVITDVRIGNRSQLVAAGALPGAMFSEVSVDVFTHWDTAEVGNQIVLSATNLIAAARTLRASMLGAAALRG